MDKKSRINYIDCHKVVNGIEYKMCKECLEWFPMNSDNFKVQPSQKDGYSHKCIECNYKYAHERYMKNRDKEIEASKKRNQEKREELLPYWSEYYFKNKSRKRKNHQRWYQEHKEYRAEYQAEYRQTESCKESMKKSQENRKLHKKHNIKTEEWQSCKKYFDYKCAYCGKSIEENIVIRKGKPKQFDFAKDHVDNCGNNNLSNCVPACDTCNNCKKTMELHEWYSEDNPIFSKERLDKIFKWLDEDCYNYLIPRKKKN